MLLIISGTSLAQSSPPPECSQSLDQLKQINQGLYESAKKRIHGDTKELDTCFSLTNYHLGDCDQTPKLNNFCAKTGTATIPGDGTVAAIDNQIASMVNTANCQFAMSNCYTNQSMVEEARRTNRNQGCWFNQERIAAQHNYADPADADQAGNAEAIKKYAIDFYLKVDRPQGECWRKMGAQSELVARQTLASSMNIKTGQALSETIYCVNNDIGNRVCNFDPTGKQTFKETAPDDGRPDVGSTSPGKFVNADGTSGNCGGSLLGDGSTFLTVGHCTQSLSSPNQMVAVTDASGTLRYVDATCSTGQFTRTTQADISTCTLSTPVPANPVYYATLDTSNSGNACTTSGYVMSCGEGWFKNLTNQPVTMWAYPAQFDTSTLDITHNLTESTGTMIYDPTTHQLTTDMMCSGGCSGSGYYTNVDGKTVIVGANSYGSRYDVGTGAAAVPTQVYQGLVVPSVSTKKLENGSPLFQKIPY